MPVISSRGPPYADRLRGPDRVFAVLLGAVLSFLGFGVQPPAAD
jgi:hypothetical protein